MTKQFEHLPTTPNCPYRCRDCGHPYNGAVCHGCSLNADRRTAIEVLRLSHADAKEMANNIQRLFRWRDMAKSTIDQFYMEMLAERERSQPGTREHETLGILINRFDALFNDLVKPG